jgi:hypothetical protein
VMCRVFPSVHPVGFHASADADVIGFFICFLSYPMLALTRSINRDWSPPSSLSHWSPYRSPLPFSHTHHLDDGGSPHVVCSRLLQPDNGKGCTSLLLTIHFCLL